MIDFQPCSDHIWVEPDEPRMSLGGLHLPEVAREEKAEKFPGTGTVLAVGPGPWLKDGVKCEMPCKKGDRILFTLFRHNCFQPRDRSLVFLAPDQVVAIVQGEPELD